MAMIELRPEVTAHALELVLAYGKSERIPLADLLASVVLGAFGLLSNGMNEEQFRELVAQLSERTAPIRRGTEERWERTGRRTCGDVS